MIKGGDYMNIGDVCIHKGKDYVYITAGLYMGTHGISNHWTFRYINDDGTLSEDTGSDYDNGVFEKVHNAVAVTKIYFN